MVLASAFSFKGCSNSMALFIAGFVLAVSFTPDWGNPCKKQMKRSKIRTGIGFN
jgi:hypothetical protein